MLVESLDINKIFQNTDNSDEIQPQDYTFLHEHHIYQSVTMVKAILNYTKHKYLDTNKQHHNDIDVLNLVSFKPYRILLQEIAAQFTVYAAINKIDTNDRNVYILAIYRSIILSTEPLISSKNEFSKLYNDRYNKIKKTYAASFVLKKFSKLLRNIIVMQEQGIINKNVDPIELSREIIISKKYNNTIRKDIREYTKNKIFEFIKTTHTTLMSNTYPSLKLRISTPIKERNTLFVVGGPGSGKTSYVNQLKKTLEDISDYVEISTDSYKELLMSPPSVPKLMLGYSQLVQPEASFIKGQALKLAVEESMNILIDQVSFSRHILEEQKLQKGIIRVIVMSAQISVALERNNTRGIGGGRFEDTYGILNKHKNTVIEVIENIGLLLTAEYKDAKIIFQDNSSNNHQNIREFMEINCTQKKVIIKNRELLKQFFKNKFLYIPQKITDILDQTIIYYEKTDKELIKAVDEELRNFFKKVFKFGGQVKKIVRSKRKTYAIESFSSTAITPSYSANVSSCPAFKYILAIDEHKEDTSLQACPKRACFRTVTQNHALRAFGKN